MRLALNSYYDFMEREIVEKLMRRKIYIRKTLAVMLSMGMAFSQPMSMPFETEIALAEETTSEEEETTEEETENGKIIIEDQNIIVEFEEGVLIVSGSGNMPAYKLEDAPWNQFREKITYLIIEQGITSISEAAFRNCPILQGVEIPYSVKIIEKGAFANDNSLSQIIGMRGVEEICSYAFQGCGFIEFSFPSNVSKIGDYVFYNTEKLEKIQLNAGNTQVGMIGYGCRGLKEISVSKGNMNYAAVDGVLFDKSLTTLMCYPASGAEEYVVPDTVENINSYAFAYSHINTVQIRDGVKKLGNGAFYSSDLFDLTLPDSVSQIGSLLCGECKSLEFVELGNGVKDLGSKTFSGCEKLRNISISKNVEYIKSGAFSGCTELVEVEIPENVRGIEANAFPQHTNLIFNDEMTIMENGAYRKINYVPVNANKKYNLAFDVLELVNTERKKYDLNPIYMDADLLEAAMQRAVEASVLFSHTRPADMDCFSVNEKIMAENLMAGTERPKEAMAQWLKSEGHRANILNPDYTALGIGVVEIDGMYYWVQCFGENEVAEPAVEIRNESEKYMIACEKEFDKISFALMPDKYTSGNLILHAGEKSDKVYLGVDNGYVMNNLWTSDVEYKSSNSKVCVVTTTGTIKAVGKGQATITVSVKGAENVKKTLRVMVLEKAIEEPEEPEKTEEQVPDMSAVYRTHVQSYGWQNFVTNGIVSGTSGEAKRLEGIEICLQGKADMQIQYTTHCQSYGWMPWSSDGDMSGTSGEAKRLEAIKIQLSGKDADKYDVYYRVHAQSYGWLGWTKNGEAAGTSGYGKRLEGIQIIVLKKDEKLNENYGGITSAENAAYIAKAGTSPVYGGTTTSALYPYIPGSAVTNVTYRTHVQSYGWQGYRYNGKMSGTEGEAKRLEGIEIKLTNQQYTGNIIYTTHVQSYGWQGDINNKNTWKINGAMSGTSGQSKRLEAICIDLTGEMAENYDVYYRVHAQSYGWLGWAKNGAPAGTAGCAKRLEGIEICLVKKGGSAPGTTFNSYIEK